MSVKTRKDKIEKLIPKITILLRKQGIATQFDMPGSQPDEKYHVSISKVQVGEVEGIKFYEYPVFCLKKNIENLQKPVIQSGSDVLLSTTITGSEDCKGNSNGHNTVCYHSLAVLKKRAEPDVKITYADSFLDAIRLLSFGGKLIKVVSKQNNGVVWGVAK